MTKLALLILVPGTVLTALVINLLALAGWIGRQWERSDLIRPSTGYSPQLLILRGDPRQLPFEWRSTAAPA
jgi:hypothetical protein